MRPQSVDSTASLLSRAICEPLWPPIVDSTASLCSVSRTLRNDAVESMFRRRKGSRTACSRAPRAGRN
eukprot:4202814-Lingulodinium_polyedra.AAC.1